MCMCLLTTCSGYQSWSGKDFEFCHFCPRAAIGHSTNECMKQWKGEIYSDAWSVENWTYVPVVSAWLNADILYIRIYSSTHAQKPWMCISVHSVHLGSLEIKNKTYRWRSRDIWEVHVLLLLLLLLLLCVIF